MGLLNELRVVKGFVHQVLPTRGPSREPSGSGDHAALMDSQTNDLTVGGTRATGRLPPGNSET